MAATLDPKLRNGIGASQIGMLFGYGYKSAGPMELYMQLVHPEQTPATADQKRGISAEPLLAERYAEDHGLMHLLHVGPEPSGITGLWCPPTQRHPAHDFLIASPDRVVLRDGKLTQIVEIKTAASSAGWEDPAEVPDGIPFGYMLQVQQQLACGVVINGEWQQCDEAHVIACVRHFRDYREYTVQRSAKIEAAIVEAAGVFWSEHVLPRREPAFDGSAAGDALLKLLYPADMRPTLAVADQTANDIAQRLRAYEGQLEEVEGRVDTERQLLKALIADGPGIQGDGWRATWKKNKDSQSVDWKAVADELSTLLKPAELAKLHAKHTTTKPGARPLRVTWKDPT